MKTALVFRFSAMGDVALTMATLSTVISDNKELRIIMVTRPKFESFFKGTPQITFFGADLDKNYKGLKGLFKLYKELKSFHPDFVIDLHQNLRTQILKTFFQFSGVKIFGLNKHRGQKKSIIRGKSKTPIKHVTEQYLDVFKNAGLVSSHIHTKKVTPIFKVEPSDKLNRFLESLDLNQTIGIAPFAQHKGKIWPIEKYRQLLELLVREIPNLKIIIFGGGAKEKEAINLLTSELNNALNVVGEFSLDDELVLISKLKTFLTGDTSNMHFATMMGVNTLSIWGATDPITGFGPLFQLEQNTIKINDLDCRPCSVFGKEPCKRGDYACLNRITPETVLNKIKASI